MKDDLYRVLILDDDAALGELLQEYLHNTGQCAAVYLCSEVDFWELLRHDTTFDILFLDYKLSPQTTGLDVLARMGQAGITIPTVMMTGEGSEMVAVKAIQTGALDYLVKADYNFNILLPLIEKAVRLREMQRAMQQSLDQIRYQALLLDNMRDAVVVWGSDGAITYWNAAAENLYAAAAAERMGQQVSDVFFPCFDPPLTPQELLRSGNMQVDHRYNLPGGEQIWVSSHVTALQPESSGGEPVGYMNVARDITPRKREQEALVQSQHFVQRILDTSPNIIYIFDLRAGTIRYVNSEIHEILGYPVEDFLRFSLNEFIHTAHPDDRPLLAQHLHPETVWRDGAVVELEFRFRGQSGNWRWLKSRETVFSRAPNGEVVEIIGVIQDITTSKEAEQALRASEARYRAIVDDHQTEMICRFLPDGTLTFVNEAYCRYYNSARDTLIGTNFFAPMLEESRHEAEETLGDLDVDHPVVIFEQQVRLPDSRQRWQEWVGRAIFDARGSFLEYQAVGRDVTERKHLEAQIQAAQTRLAQAARLSSIGELASGVAHQISNPLTTIIADAQILAYQLDRSHPARESADAIVQAGWRAQQVITELMKFSQPSKGSYEPVSVSDTIQTALLLASAHIHVSGIDLIVDIAEDLPKISANARQLTDLWVNLLLLARSAFVDGESHHIRIQARKEGDSAILVEVADDGTPIPPEQHDTIFEPQLLAAGTGRGTGMELSICREIVRQHRGQITVSRRGQETVFTIQFALEGTFAWTQSASW